MSVYVDNLRKTLKSKHWLFDEGCHLVADSDDELHSFAVRLGLKTKWFQKNTIHHYDLTRGMRFKALKFGALEIADLRLVEMIRGKRNI